MASTLKVTDIAYPGSANTAITINANDSVSMNGGVVSPQTGFKNRIINGGMTIDQRNNGAAVTTDNAFTVDRFGQRQVGGGVLSYQSSSTAPAGFINSLAVTVTTADASIAASDNYNLFQRIEGLNVADLGWGTASAQTVTLSFWVRSSLTGTFGGSLMNSAANRSYVFQYTISAANTWEQKTITVAGDTSGTWLTTNGVGIGVIFDMGSGTDYNGTANAWNAAQNRRASGNVQLVGTLSATWYITGVQLEKGSTATPFEFRSIGQELALCQRYYEQLATTYHAESPYGAGVNPRSYWWYKVTKRATPTVINSGTSAVGTLYIGTTSGVGLNNAIGGATAFGSTASSSAEL